jgi:SAM-dependent MidA family methyltransferase
VQIPLNQSEQAFPAPSADALAHSEKLSALIRADIMDHGGWIPFERYMELALYAPGLGYYSAGAKKIGKDGDFITAPEISSLFGQSIAQCAAEVIAKTDGDIVEFGAGSGKLAFDLLTELQRLDQLPQNYFILEVSADLRERQQILLSSLPANVFLRVKWIDKLFNKFNGLIIGNEVLDAMPTHLIAWSERGILERGVATENQQFVFQDREVATQSGLFAAATKLNLPDGYVSEINLAYRLRIFRCRVLSSSTQYGHADVSLPSSRSCRSILFARPARHHQPCGFFCDSASGRTGWLGDAWLYITSAIFARLRHY